VAFGNLNNKYSEGYKDMSSREWAIIMPLTVLTILLGVFPDLVFDTILCSVSLVVYQCGFF
jgi:NADH:ubiquinone oxidoreductase subunit 4 (subunit M)